MVEASSLAVPAKRAPVDRPTVLHVITDSFSASTVVAPLVKYCDEAGWRSVVACSGKRYEDAHSFMDWMRNQSLDVRDLEIRRDISPIADLQRIIDVWALIRRERPALVHTHLAKAGIIGRMAARLARAPCVHTVYDYAFVEQSGLKRGAYRVIERVAAGMARRIMFVSENERRISLVEGVGALGQLTTVGQGIDLRRFDPATVEDRAVVDVKHRFGVPEYSVVIGTVARLVHRKRIDLLLKAASQLPREINWHVLVCGGGPLRHQLGELVRELGISARVSFTGFIEDPCLMPVVMKAIDVFCLPSTREGYGMAYAEAGAMAKPVVAPDAAPMNALVVEGRTGLLTKPGDVGSITVSLETILRNERLRVAMGEEGRRYVTAKCDMRDTFERIVRVYEDVLSLASVVRGTSLDLT